MSEEVKMVEIPEELLKRLITNLWYQAPGLDDVTELSKDLIDEYPELFVDVIEDDEYKGTRPEWLGETDEYCNTTNLIYAPQDDDADPDE